MFKTLKKLWPSSHRAESLEASLATLRQRTPVPVFWLFGKTQSGKTSIIKFLTGAAEAEIGEGFRPCTRTSREYDFPTPEAPLLSFLDTRGLDEPSYDATEDLARFNDQAHLVLVTAKVLDHALENLIAQLRRLRAAKPGRPVVLALTCLHEAEPQSQHPQPYPFTDTLDSPTVPPDLTRSLAEQQKRFAGLADVIVPIDLTRPEEGYADVNYGGERLKQVLIERLPHAYRETLKTLDLATRELSDAAARRSLPVILGYTALAATAGAIPVPWVDLLILPGVQSQMIHHLARQYGQPLSGARFVEIATTLGLGMLARQAVREVAKFIPYVGSVAGAALAAASTYALGQAFCYYYRVVREGHVPDPEDLRRYYREQLSQAEKMWARKV
jgi:uncharacterized protein (DUF697 family)/predicted GTPase